MTKLILAVAVLLAGYGFVRVGPAAFQYGTPGISLASNHMQMLEATTADSYTPAADPLRPAGWTAVASSQQGGHPASYVLDGKRATFWHSEYSPKVVPLPHSITINMHALHYVAGLTYLPRQDGVSNGNIGQYSISVSRDGKHWGSPVASGTWADDNTQKSAVFGGVLVRYVRLTALTEAGNRGPYTSAAEIRLLGGPALGPALPRNGWTVSADSQAKADPAKYILDGDGLTIWSTAYTGKVPRLPHHITIDMHRTHLISGLSYLPRQDGNSNGDIGRFSVSVSSNGRNWSKPVAAGKWADDASQKYAVFKARSARFVRLTALTEAGNRGPWTSAAEINILGVAPSVGVGGKWSAPIGFPLVPASAVLLPNDKLLTFSAVDDMAFTKTEDAITNVAVLNLRTGKVTGPAQIDTHHQMFCEGLAVLPDGRVLINGGSNDKATTIYNPYTNTWTVGPLMNIPRAYEGDTTLSTGQVLTLGGSWYDSAGDKNGEIFTTSGATGSWRELPGVLASRILTNDPAGIFRADNHAWLFAQANGTRLPGRTQQAHELDQYQGQRRDDLRGEARHDRGRDERQRRHVRRGQDRRCRRRDGL